MLGWINFCLYSCLLILELGHFWKIRDFLDVGEISFLVILLLLSIIGFLIVKRFVLLGHLFACVPS